MTRDERQEKVFAWAKAAFGTAHATSLPQCGMRMLKEALELFEACGGDSETALKLVDFVSDHGAGEISQEIGGLQVAVLALAAAAGLSANEQEARQVDRVRSLSPEEFARRNAVKAAEFTYQPFAEQADASDARIRELESQLEAMRRQHASVERAMRSAVSSAKAAEAIALRYMGANGALERIADAAQYLVRSVGGDDIEHRFAMLRNALANRIIAGSNPGPAHNED